MSIESPPSPEDKLKFTRPEQVQTRVEQLLKHEYGRGIYVHDSYETRAGDLVLSLGNSVPRNLSDCRNDDKMLKFVNIRDVMTLRAEKTEEHYLIELPERDDVYDAYIGRREEILDKLDWSMAKAIYENVFDLPPVRNQLNSIIQIIRWTLENPGITRTRIDSIQRTSNTSEYIQVLEELEFLRVENGEIFAGEALQRSELEQRSADETVKAAVGQVVQDGYHVLRERLDLRMLSHYPKFANAYYYDAIQRQEPELWLDVDTVQENLKEEWGDIYDRLVVDDKLRDLHRAGVLEKDGKYVKSRESVFDQVSAEAPVI